jgi:triosephosphate isomerase
MTKFIVANWKMYLDVKTSVFLARKIKVVKTKHRVVLAPTMPAMAQVKKACGKLAVAAQDVSWAERGAYTGEMAAADLKEAGCKYAIIAHSERRKYAGETYERANQKIAQCLKSGLTPILCVGESEAEKKSGKTLEVIAAQLSAALKNIAVGKKMIVAYEPIWAIGTGNSETPENANLVQGAIKKQAGDIPVLYGGSVDSKNFSSFLAQKNIDGLLIGGASTKWEEIRVILRK